MGQSEFYIDEDGMCPSKVPKELQNVKGAKWKPNCQDSKSVVMHPFKKPDEYFKCLCRDTVDVDMVLQTMGALGARGRCGSGQGVEAIPFGSTFGLHWAMCLSCEPRSSYRRGTVCDSIDFTAFSWFLTMGACSGTD